MARKKISYKIPPLRQMGLPGGLKQTGFAHEGVQGMTNYQQFATPETHTMGHMDRTAQYGQNPGGFMPTYIANTNPINPQLQQNAINTGKPLVDNVKESVNTFSSDIDPADKTEFKNEVINDVMSNVNPPEMQAPQNKLEELYKPV